MTTPHIIILGAGASGLNLAWRLAENGVSTQVLEAEPIVGGLAGTVREDGYALDFGPHSFFSEDDQIVRAMLELFNGELKPQPRSVKFYYRGKYLDYPLTPAGVLVQMGPLAGLRAALSFLASQLNPRVMIRPEGEDETVEDWAINSFGHYLYKSFFKPYTEQFWKVSCRELSARSIPSHTRMSFLKTLQLLVRERVSKLNPSMIEREKLPTYYPESGFGEILDRVSERVRAAGGQINTGCEAVAIDTSGDGVRVAYQQAGQLSECVGTQLISTIPLGKMVSLLTPRPYATVQASTEQLDYRALVALGVVTSKQDILDSGYIYLLDRPYNRISEMNKFSPGTSPQGENILCLEVCCLKDSAGWKASKEELFDMCIPSLAADGILSPGDVTRLLLVRAPNAYPIYRKDYALHLKTLLGEVERRPAMRTLGRTGEFMYMDSDKCMRRAFDLGDTILRDLGITPNAQPGAQH